MAYADSASDLAMLEAVGFPVAVNPEARLAAIARRRGWHVEHWAKAKGGSHRPLPLGPFDHKSPKAVIARDVSTLLFERSLPRFAAARLASSFGSGAAPGSGRCGWWTTSRRRCRERAGCTWTRCCRASAVRTCPPWTGAARATSKRSSRSPSSPATKWWAVGGRRRRRGRRTAGRRRPGGAPTGTGLCRPRHPPVLRSLCGRARGQLRPGGVRAPQARAADRFLCRHRGRVVDHRPRGAFEPALRRPRRAQRRRRGHHRTGGVRRARRLGGRNSRGDVVAVVGAGTLGLTVTAALAHLAATGRCPAPRSLLVGARYAHQLRLAREFGATEALPPEQLAPRGAPAQPLAVLRRLLRRDGNPHRRGRRGDRLRRQRRIDRPVVGHGPAPRHRRPGRHARQGDDRPGAAVAPRGPPRRRLRLRHRIGATRGRRGGGDDECCRHDETKEGRSPARRGAHIPTGLRRGGRAVDGSPRLGHLSPHPVRRSGGACRGRRRRGAVKIAFDITKGHTR